MKCSYRGCFRSVARLSKTKMATLAGVRLGSFPRLLMLAVLAAGLVTHANAGSIITVVDGPTSDPAQGAGDRGPEMTLLALEPRLLLDTAAATAADAADDGGTDGDTDAGGGSAPAAKDQATKDQAADAKAAGDDLAAQALDQAGSDGGEIVFIDTGVEGWEALADGVDPRVQLVLVGSNEDGMRVIADTLAGRSDVHSVHVLGHGSAGVFDLGSARLSSSALADYAGELAEIRDALSADANLLLYGCYVGADGAGQAFVDALAKATGADVAASDDLTGSARLDGDWDLEVAHGSVDVSAIKLDGWSGVLAAAPDIFVATSNPGDFDPSVDPGDALLKISGGATSTVFSESLVENANAVAVDLANDRAWILGNSSPNDIIFEVNLSTGIVSTLHTSDVKDAQDIEYDPENNDLYFTASDIFGTGVVNLTRFDLDDNSVSVIASGFDGNATGLAIDVANDRAWTYSNNDDRITQITLSTGASSFMLSGIENINDLEWGATEGRLYLVQTEFFGSGANRFGYTGPNGGSITNINTERGYSTLAIDEASGIAVASNASEGIVYQIDLPSGTSSQVFVGNTATDPTNRVPRAVAIGSAGNEAPSIAGTAATPTIDDTAMTTPFSPLSFSDPEGDGGTIAITYTGANGTLSGTGLTQNGSGDYTLAGGTAAELTSRLQALVFTPTTNQVVPTNTVQTTFTLTPNDGSLTGTANSDTQVTATSVNDAPAFDTSPISISVDEGSSVNFASQIDLSDPDTGQTLTVSQASAPGFGTLGFAAATVGTPASGSSPTTVTYNASAVDADAGNTSTSFTLQVSDATGNAATALTVNVTVNDIDDNDVSFQSLDVSGATGVATGATLTATFDQAIELGSGNVMLRALTAGASDIVIDAGSPAGQLSVAGSDLQIVPAGGLAAGVQYRLEYDAGAIGAAGVDPDTAAALGAGGPTFTTVPLVRLTTADGSVGETGDSETLTLTLVDAAGNQVARVPTGNVTVPITTTLGSAEAGDFALSPTSVSFSAGSTFTALSFTLTPTADSVLEGDETVTVGLGSITNGVADTTNTQVVTITDDETVAIADASGTEGDGTLSFDVEVRDESNAVGTTAANTTFVVDTSDGTATAGDDYTAITGASGQIDAGQGSTSVTVSIADDQTVDGGPETFTVTLSGLSAGGFSDATATGTIADNDTAGFTVTETGGDTTVAETGTTDTFDVVLDAQPESDVVISVTSGDTGEASVSPATLTFTNANWNVAQTVTVTGVDDGATVDGNQTTTVTLSVVDGSSNDSFDPLGDQTVSVVTQDNDIPTVVSLAPSSPASGPTNSDTANLLVTFSAPIDAGTEPTTDDFTPDLSGVTIGGFTVDDNAGDGDAATFRILATGVAGDGTLGFTFQDDDSVEISGVPIGGVGVGNGDFTGLTLSVDNTAPTVTIAPIAGDDRLNAAEDDSNVTISGTATGANGQTVSIAVSGNALTATVGAGGAWSATLAQADAEALADGSVSVTADVDDQAGNSATQATRTLTVDTAAPTIAIDTVAGDDIINAAESSMATAIAGTTDAEDGQNVTVTVGGQSATGSVAGGAWTANLTATQSQALADGGATVTADVEDLAGNAASQATRAITVDTAPPSLSAVDLVGASDTGTSNTDDITSDATPTIEFTAGSGATIAIDWADGTGFVAASTGTGMAQQETLGTAYATDGDKPITVRVRDDAGNEAAASITVTVDTTDPVLTAITRGNPLQEVTNADSLTFEVQFDSQIFNLDAGDFTASGTTASGTAVSIFGSGDRWGITISGGDLDNFNGTVGLALDGGNDLADAAGNPLDNVAPATDETYTVKNTAPQLESIVRHTPTDETTNADTLTFRLTFDFDVEQVDAGDFVVTGGTSAAVSLVSILTPHTEFLVTVSGGDLADLDGTVGLDLAPGQDIADAAGNALPTSEPGTDETFTVDNTAPAVTVNTLTTSDTTPPLSGTVDDNDATLELTLDGQTVTPTNNGDGTWTLADDTLAALALGTFDVAVTATDPAGNEGSDATADELTITTDSDGDGIDDSIENAGPNGGDGNNDSTPDAEQSNVASVPTATGRGYMTLATSGACTALQQVAAVDSASLPADPDSSAYPFGLVEFRLSCETAIVEVVFHDAAAGELADSTYRKYGPVTPGDTATTAWYDFSDYATLTGNTWTLDLADDRLGDDTGDDGIIVDQGGPASGQAGGQAVPIPVDRTWALLLLILSSLILAHRYLPRTARQSGRF